MSVDKFEMPEEMRQMMEKGVAQAREGFDKVMSVASEAASTLEQKAGAAQADALEARKKTLAITENAMNASFELARNLVGAKSVEEVLKLQSSYVSQQVTSLSSHMSEAGAELQRKAQAASEEMAAEAAKMQSKAKEAMEQGVTALKDVNPFKK